MANRDMKRCPTALMIKEMQIKTTVRYHPKHVRMAVIKKRRDTSAGEDVKIKEFCVLWVGM